MNEKKKTLDPAAYAIGGGLMLGMGVGFFLFPAAVIGQTSVFAFIGCMIGGLGAGLLIAAFISKRH